MYSTLPSYDEGLETFASRFLQLKLDVQMECKHQAVNDNSMAQQMLNALSKSIYSSTAEDFERKGIMATAQRYKRRLVPTPVTTALIAGVGLLVMIAMLTSCAGIWLEGYTKHKGL